MRQRVPRRASLRSCAAAGLTILTLRPLTSVLPASPRTVRAARRVVAACLAVAGPPLAGSRISSVVRMSPGGPMVRGEWVRAPRARRDDAVILYLHGSAYTLCSARTHRGITTRLSQLTGLPVFACDYRLGPRHHHPSAADDVRAAYDWLLAEGHDPGRILVAGDSAGGHFGVDLSIQLMQEGAQPPVALAFFSPLFDPTFRLAAARDRRRRDPMIPATQAMRLLDMYFAEADRSEPRLTFALEDASEFPPTLVQAGGREMMSADAEELAGAITAAGGRCDLEIWPGQMHVFQAMSRVVPEADAALARSAEFLLDELAATERRASVTVLRGS